jgi:UDP-N-acetylmuramate--alanine ligase
LSTGPSRYSRPRGGHEINVWAEHAPYTGQDVLGRTRWIHFVGIGGIGMSGIAELLVNLGYRVSGSDVTRSEMAERLATLGAEVHFGHAADHVGEADVVVVSSAVPASNPEVVAARRRQIPVIPRAEMLAELMRLRYGIAVAGAHGKTSTTSMIALVLERAGLDPTAVIGGRLSAFGSNARLGRGEYMVAEADESDRSFLRLSPVIAVITNIDREHLESYGDMADLKRAFLRFANRVPFYGAAVVCLDDPHLRELVPQMTRRVITYGLESPADLVATGIDLEAFGARGEVLARRHGGQQPLGTLRLQVPGRHNVLNALAAVGVGLELGVPFERIAGALAGFHGAERRFQRLGEAGQVMVVDDYGHHPTEIAAVLSAARAGLNRRVLVVFQPHRYSRTLALMQEFAAVLPGADEIVLTDIYGAGERPVSGVTVDALAAAVRARTGVPVHVVAELGRLPAYVVALARPGDLILTLGAGSIGRVGPQILAELQRTRRAD